MYERCLTNLHNKVSLLRETETFEQNLSRRVSQAGMTEQPSSNNIDVIMRSMMDCTTNDRFSQDHLSRSDGRNRKGKGRSQS
jgi:hypothetical protein